jgi:hypothetical protein
MSRSRRFSRPQNGACQVPIGFSDGEAYFFTGTLAPPRLLVHLSQISDCGIECVVLKALNAFEIARCSRFVSIDTGEVHSIALVGDVPPEEWVFGLQVEQLDGEDFAVSLLNKDHAPFVALRATILT